MKVFSKHTKGNKIITIQFGSQNKDFIKLAFSDNRKVKEKFDVKIFVELHADEMNINNKEKKELIDLLQKECNKINL